VFYATVYTEDMCVLLDDTVRNGYLSDSVANAFLSLCTDWFYEKGVLILNSFLFEMFVKKTNIVHLQAVGKLSGEELKKLCVFPLANGLRTFLKKRVFKDGEPPVRIICIPINIPGIGHWACAIVDFRTNDVCRISYVDSLNISTRLSIIERNMCQLIQYLICHIKEVFGDKCKHWPNTYEFVHLCHAIQPDGKNCLLYMLFHIEAFCADKLMKDVLPYGRKENSTTFLRQARKYIAHLISTNAVCTQVPLEADVDSDL
jgi:Ulp1 protease family, C-terminal catalytic domain